MNNFPESEMTEVIIVSQLQKLYDAYVERKRENGDQLSILFNLNRAEITAIQYMRRADVLNDLFDKQEILDLAWEQTEDEDIMQAIVWKSNGLSSNFKYAS